MSSSTYRTEAIDAGTPSSLNTHQKEALAHGGYDVDPNASKALAGEGLPSGAEHHDEVPNAGELSGLNAHQKEAVAKRDAAE
ncbi:hypothetical protein HDU87_002850 [Geranomyces variabilis]|uniref:Uncharacterized protein n=1 Tax=Geranomyces variabilis TaxID=109894 RepID=A0AAD5XT61_9FUNG|nr:hypothetical protein HDU87_002850 [Geranomyces variabilis]